MPTFGRIEPFEGGGDDWPSYVERLQAFFFANDVDEEKKQAIFFSCCGPKTYSLLRDLVKPAHPQDKSLDEVLAILGNHYCPKPSAVVQRFRFNSRVRAEAESVSNFVAALKSLSEHCNFGTELGNMLRDRIVCGINSVAIQTRLLEQPNLTFEDAVQTALAMEAAKKDAGEICKANLNNAAFATLRVTTPMGGRILLPLWRRAPCVQLQARQQYMQLLPQARTPIKGVQFKTKGRPNVQEQF
ncbi:unnamed protein product [Ixodes hexagonus]